MTGWLLPAAGLAVAILYASVGHAGAAGLAAEDPTAVRRLSIPLLAAIGAGLGGWLATGKSLAAIDPWVVAAAATGGLVGSQWGALCLPIRWLRPSRTGRPPRRRPRSGPCRRSPLCCSLTGPQDRPATLRERR